MPDFNHAVNYLAPAKLNLFLHITARRKDGYHNLQTVFQFVDWYDELRFELNDSGEIDFDCNQPGLNNHDNLVVKAARLLQQKSGKKAGVHIQLKKQIPSGAGLGGGSSDAASTLLALNRLWQCGMKRQALMEMGVLLGADVPVFLYGNSCWAEGVGERFTPLSPPEKYYCLVKPDISINTASLFGAKDLQRDCPVLQPQSFSWQQTRNVFQPLVERQYPQVRQAIEDFAQYLKQQGFGDPKAIFKESYRMTGTGSVFFLPVRKNIPLRQLEQQLPSGYQVKLVRSFNKSMEQDWSN